MIGGKQISEPSPVGRDQNEPDGVMIFSIFSLVGRVRTHVLVEVRTHIVATTVCATKGVHTLTCCTHISAHSAFTAQVRTSSCVSHTRTAQGHEKGVCCVRM